MIARPDFFIDESEVSKECFPSFAIFISTLINAKTYPVGQLNPISPNSYKMLLLTPERQTVTVLYL